MNERYDSMYLSRHIFKTPSQFQSSADEVSPLVSKVILGVVAGFVSVISAPDLVAQWTATVLQPTALDDFYWDSRAWGVDDGQQVGWVRNSFTTTTHASLWNGTAQSWVNLHPGHASSSQAFNTHNGQQVGSVSFSPFLPVRERATLWNGNSDSIVDLHPSGLSAGFNSSVAVGIHNGQQVGWVGGPVLQRASLWSGTADSWIDLHPEGVVSSVATGIHDGIQVGIVWNNWAGDSNYLQHAGLWSGNSHSWVDLNPLGATSSRANGIHGGQQVGWAAFNATSHAGLWEGTSDSWIDLHPSAATSSNAWAVYNGQQVGSAMIDGVDRAILWNGSADSWEDLSVFLPGHWQYSQANSIWSDGKIISVVGQGSVGGTRRALLWTRTVPEPSALALLFVGLLLSLCFKRRSSRVAAYRLQTAGVGLTVCGDASAALCKNCAPAFGRV